jgi:cytochrome c oxidase assembly protein subunit 15
MSEPSIPSGFVRYAWFTLAYNIVVILWGVFLRASHSGDGCGQHWLTCQGEAIPSAPELKTAIEFSHRVTTMLAGFVVIGLVIWAFRKFAKGSIVRRLALWSLAFIIVEGAIGGGLVLTGNTAGNWTPSRPYWAAGHLINTFILIAFLALTAWYSERKREGRPRTSRKFLLLLGVGVAAIFLTGISGSMAALTNMLFPSASIAESIAKDFAPDSHILLRLRILHPLLSVFTAVYLIFLAGWLKKNAGNDAEVSRWSTVLSTLVVIQVAFGALTLVTLGPIMMQLGHLLLADAVWISYVLLAASFLYAGKEHSHLTERSNSRA